MVFSMVCTSRAFLRQPLTGIAHRTRSRYQPLCGVLQKSFHNTPFVRDDPAARSQDTEFLDWDPSAYASLPKDFGANQHMHVDEAVKEKLRNLLWELRAHIRFAVAYGSGVFSQGKVSGEQPMIDLIFGVSFPQHWHSLNLHQHPDHYSFVGKFGSGAVAYIQEKMGAGVYFNPYVEMNGTKIKYGVVSIDTLCKDLTDWNTLYLSGRLHKPVKILRDDPRVRLANHMNLLSAVRVALLLLPQTFTEQQLYMAIAGISYMGDPRMSFAENPHKVQNIVNNQVANFRRLYSPLIEQLPNVSFTSSKVSWNDSANKVTLVQDMDPVKRGNMVRRLPKDFRDKLYFQYQRKYAIPELEFQKMVNISTDEERTRKKEGGEFERRIAQDTGNIRQEVSAAIRSTVKWPSTAQSLKGLLTAGPTRSIKYLGEKVDKWRKSKKSA